MQEISLSKLVVDIIATVCELDANSLSMQTRIADLGIDSVRMVAIVGHVELVQGCEYSVDDVLAFFLTEDIDGLIAAMAKASTI